MALSRPLSFFPSLHSFLLPSVQLSAEAHATWCYGFRPRPWLHLLVFGGLAEGWNGGKILEGFLFTGWQLVPKASRNIKGSVERIMGHSGIALQTRAKCDDIHLIAMVSKPIALRISVILAAWRCDHTSFARALSSQSKHHDSICSLEFRFKGLLKGL